MNKPIPKLSAFQFFSLFLSIYVVIAVSVKYFASPSNDVKTILTIADNIICLFFLMDFCIRFYNAESKIAYMKWGWIDLLSSIPMLDLFRFGRLFRIYRLVKLTYTAHLNQHNQKNSREKTRYLWKEKLSNAFTAVALFSIILIILSAIFILHFEKDLAGATIHTAYDALWWAMVTITTVGYGDFYPVSGEGKIIAVILMTTGVGLFGTFTGFVSSFFFDDDDANNDKIAKEVTELKSEIQELKEMIRELKDK